MVQYNKFYYADADCIGVTKNIPWKINRKWMDVVAKSGTPLFVSIADDAFDEETRKLL